MPIVFAHHFGKFLIKIVGLDRELLTTYQKRWPVEVFHKSLKSNAATSKSPARRIVSQVHQVFASIVAVFKLEKLKITTHLNHFSLKAKWYVNAIHAAYDELKRLRAA